MEIKDKVIIRLEELGLIDDSCTFEITEKLLHSFQEEYTRVKGTKLSHKKQHIRYANKLAAMSLVKYKKIRGKLGKEGFVYIIKNPAWPGLYKVGITHDTKQRLRSYQTYSPHRDYSIVTYSFFNDTRSVERELLKSLPNYLNEWVSLEEKELDSIASLLHEGMGRINFDKDSSYNQLLNELLSVN